MPSIAPRFDADVLHKKSKSSKVKTFASDSEDEKVDESRAKESRKEKKEKDAEAKRKEKRKKVSSDSSESSDSDAPASKKLKSDEADQPTRLSVDEFRRKLEIKVAGSDCPAPFQTFEDASLPPELLEAVRQQGFKAPSAIQSQCWPLAMAGKDLIAIAKTGSGKTCGFLFPAFQLIKRSVSLQVPAPPPLAAC